MLGDTGNRAHPIVLLMKEQTTKSQPGLAREHVQGTPWKSRHRRARSRGCAPNQKRAGIKAIYCRPATVRDHDGVRAHSPGYAVTDFQCEPDDRGGSQADLAAGLTIGLGLRLCDDQSRFDGNVRIQRN